MRGVYICGPTDCPHDPDFEHDRGVCLPRDLDQFTGETKSHQSLTDIPGYGKRWLWDGGCHAAGIVPPHWKKRS